MARNGGDVLVKRNSKLDAFLRRTLDEDTFERVRAHEACLEKKEFKFVILSDEWIYLTENPPKKVHETVHFGDVVAVQLVNDYPSFLSGEERENTQHIEVKYITPDISPKEKKKRAKDAGIKTPRGSLSARGSLTARGSVSSKSGQDGSNLLQVPGLSRQSGSFKERKKRDESPRRPSLDEDTLRTALDEDDEPGDKKDSKKKKASKKKGSAQHGDTMASNLASTMQNRYSSSKYERTKALPRRLPDPAEEWDEQGRMVDTRKKEPLKLSYSDKGELRLALEKLADETDEEDEEEEEEEIITKTAKRGAKSNKSKSFQREGLVGTNSGKSAKADSVIVSKSTPGGTTWRRRSMAATLTGSTSARSMRPRSMSMSMLSAVTEETPLGFHNGDEEEEEDLEGDGLKEESLHIYILSYASPMMMLIRSAWHNYLIRATLLQDEEYTMQTIGYGHKTSPGEKMDHLFNQLKTELLSHGNKMEDIFNLLNELKVAAERNRNLKKLFWKTPDLFLFMVRQLQLYLPKSQSKLPAQSDEAKAERADEFEFVILLLETLSLMLRETEICPSRLQSLRVSKGKVMLDLIVALTCFPELPQKYRPPSSQVAALLNSTDSQQWKCLADAELSKLMAEFTNVATAVMSELILIAHQRGQHVQKANWGDKDGSFLNICWLVNVLDELNTTEKFVERVVGQAMRLICPSRHEELLPREAVLVFQQFSVLQTLVHFSPRTANFIRNNFHEEFKYYIQSPIIQQKLPHWYPIAPHTIRLIEEVMSEILEKTITLDLDHHYHINRSDKMR